MAGAIYAAFRTNSRLDLSCGFINSTPMFLYAKILPSFSWYFYVAFKSTNYPTCPTQYTKSSNLLIFIGMNSYCHIQGGCIPGKTRLTEGRTEL